ncbi:MAG: T9SS type A sorting domain-containing protein [Bacteroidetes bacterium]|nr:T9SS type A sorting domain-containing protein [Bacteroidota bacterium]
MSQIIKSDFLVFSMVLALNTSLFAWTSSNEGKCYTLDTLDLLSDSIYFDTSEERFVAFCNLIILENDSLIIDAGQSLMFLEYVIPPGIFEYYGIEMYGTMLAIGEKDNIIYLGDKYYDFSEGNIWCGVQFYNTSKNGESILKYCIITGAINANGDEFTYNGDVGIFCENSSPIIDHCNFRYMISDWETGGGSAIACRGQSYPVVSYCKFEQLLNSIAIWCNPWDTSPDTVNYPSPLVYGCNIMPSVLSFFFDVIDYDVAIYRGGFLDNCYLGAYNNNYADNTLGIPIDTIGDGICGTTSTYWMKRFMDVDGVTHPRSDTLITGINESEIEILPTTSQHLLLKNNFPNPFSDVTTIGFEVKTESAMISLAIDDSKGNSVRKLINNAKFAKGTYSSNWSGDNEQGEKVGSGIYFYKLSSDNQVLVKKAIVVK